jgi:hypothetical protein
MVVIAVAVTPLLARAGPQEKIKELQKERIDILKKQVDVLTKLVFLPGRAGQLDHFGEALEATQRLLRAELEVTEKVADRLALYKKAIARLKEYEKVAQAMVTTGRITEATGLRIKARRLEVEIELEREKVREAKERK